MKKKRMTVEDLMTTNVVPVTETSSIAAALETMRLAHFHHFPVVDKRNHVVGMLSDRDLLRGLAASSGQADPIATVMTRNVQTVRAATSLTEAAAILEEGGFSSLPVVAEDDTLIGIVTTRDFLSVVRSLLQD